MVARLASRLGLGLLLVGCGADREAELTSPKQGVPPETSADEATGPMSRGFAANIAPAPAPVDRVAQAQPAIRSMIIRTGEVSIRVDSLEPAIRLVADLAARAGGYLANTVSQTGEGAERAATLEIKIPADRYSGTLDLLTRIGKVVSARTTAQDVGEEFVDVTARVANARRLEARLIDLLATRTGKLVDVLNVERELARVREEIERYQGRIRYLEAQVAMSTLSVHVFEPGPLVGDPGSNPIVEAFEQSWRNFVTATTWIIAALGGLVPAALGLALVFLGYRRYRRRPATA